MKTNPNTYFGYQDNGIHYAAQGISKTKFISLVQAYYFKGGHITASWVRDRISQGANEKVLEHLKNNPNHFLMISDNYEIIQKVQL